MIDLYYWPTPNGWKVTIMLEECGLPYTIKPVNIGRGDQLSPGFLKLSPNGADAGNCRSRTNRRWRARSRSGWSNGASA